MVEKIRKLLESTSEEDVWLGLNIASSKISKEEFEHLINRDFDLNTRITGDNVVIIHGTEYVVYGTRIWIRGVNDEIYPETKIIDLKK